jgi:hypothetical protein
MLAVVLFIGCTVPPANVTPAPGKGWWWTKDCVWSMMDCPRAPAIPGKVQILPMGCPAPQPTIAYSREADTRIRKDFAEAKVLIEGLEIELKTSRSNLTLATNKTMALIKESDRILGKCLDVAELQTKTLEEIESQTTWMKRGVVLTAALALAGVVVIGLIR